MQTVSFKNIRLAILITLLFLAGCAGNQDFTRATAAAQTGDWDVAVRHYEDAYRKDSSNKDYKLELRRARFEAAKEHLKRGSSLLSLRNYGKAVEEFGKSLAFDPTFANAQNGLETARTFQEAERAYESGMSLQKVGKEAEARDSFARAVDMNPQHAEAVEQLKALARKSQKPVIGQFEINLKSTKPITLKLADTTVKEAFSILSKLSGVNFLFDDEVREKRVTLTLENVKFEQALDMLMTVSGLSRKVVSENTIIVFPTTPAKLAQYQDHYIRTFFLSNLDAKKMVNLVRSIIQVKKIFVNEETNAIVVRDDPEVIDVVRKIIEANDIVDSEIMLDVEILEVDRSRILDLGLEVVPPVVSARISETGATTGATVATTGATVTYKTLKNLTSSNILFTVPGLTANLKSETSGTEILANPKIRVKNRSKARIHIGERVPIITSNTNLGVISENIQYQDIGVKFDVEPWIHHNNEVTLKLKLEVSSLGPQVSGAQTIAYRIGARTTETELRLHDRETQIIGGLINDEERTTITKIPGLGDIPGLGYLFSSHDRSKVKTDILMSITPYILRNMGTPPKETVNIWSGRENAVSASRPTYDTQPDGGSDPMAMPVEGSGGGAITPKSSPESMFAPEPVPTPASQATPIGLSMRAPKDVSVGVPFDVEVVVDGAKGVFSFPTSIAFDAARLKYLGSTEGEFLKQDGKLTSFVVAPGAGRLTVGLSRVGDVGGVDGGGRLFTLRFQAIQPGPASMRIVDPLPRDASRRILAARPADWTVEAR